MVIFIKTDKASMEFDNIYRAYRKFEYVYYHKKLSAKAIVEESNGIREFKTPKDLLVFIEELRRYACDNNHQKSLFEQE